MLPKLAVLDAIATLTLTACTTVYLGTANPFVFRLGWRARICQYSIKYLRKNIYKSKLPVYFILKISLIVLLYTVMY
jgi:hypothetical protein